MSGMVLHSAFDLDQVSNTRRSPQVAFVAQSVWPALQPALDAPQVFRAQAGFASCPPGPLQRPHATLFELFCPTSNRLPVYLYPTCDFGSMDPLAKQFVRLTTALL